MKKAEGDGVIALPKTRLLYVALVVFVTLPTVTLIALSPMVEGVWCQHFDIPQHEQVFGFRLGSVELPGSTGGSSSTTGVVWVRPEGGFRPRGCASRRCFATSPRRQ